MRDFSKGELVGFAAFNPDRKELRLISVEDHRVINRSTLLDIIQVHIDEQLYKYENELALDEPIGDKIDYENRRNDRLETCQNLQILSRLD